MSPTGDEGEGGEATGAVCSSLPQAPSVSGELFQIRLGSSFTSLVLLISIQPVFVLRTYAADANFKLMHTLSYVMSVQSLARVPYVVLFNLTALNKDGIWQVCITFTLWQHDLHV